MPTPAIYQRESTITTSARIRESAREAADQLAADLGTVRARVMADALEEYLAARVPDFEPVLVVETPRQDQLDVA